MIFIYEIQIEHIDLTGRDVWCHVTMLHIIVDL